MLSNRLSAFLLLGLVVLVAGCGDDNESESPQIEVSDEQLIPQISTWVNQLGLSQADPVVWRQRLDRACTEGVWEEDVARELAEEFIQEDLAVSVRGEGLGPPSVDDGAQALWIMAVNVCRYAFPEGAIDSGPSSP